MPVINRSKLRQAVQGQLPWDEVGFSEKDPNDWYAIFLVERNNADNTLIKEYSDSEDADVEVDWSLFQSELEDETVTRMIEALVSCGYTIKED